MVFDLMGVDSFEAAVSNYCVVVELMVVLTVGDSDTATAGKMGSSMAVLLETKLAAETAV